MTAWAHQGAAREPTDAKKFRPGAGENFGQRCGEITWSFVEVTARYRCVHTCLLQFRALAQSRDLLGVLRTKWKI